MARESGDAPIDARRLERLVDQEFRRGRSLNDLFPELERTQSRLSDASRARHELRQRFGPKSPHFKDHLVAANEAVNEARRELRAEMRALLEKDLLPVADLYATPGDLWQLEQVPDVPGKPTYRCVSSDRVRLLVRKLILGEVKRLVPPRSKSGDRHGVSKAVALSLADGAPKVVVRSDITSFYESISHEHLRSLVSRQAGATARIRRHVDVALAEYTRASGRSKGVPRGLALAAVLGDLALSPLDEHFMMSNEVSLYCRYVDDIIVVFGTWAGAPSGSERLAQVEAEVKELGLRVKASKTRHFALPAPKAAPPVKVNFLGYQLILDDPLRIELSEKRVRRAFARLESTFRSFEEDKNRSRAVPALVERVRVLTSNYRLKNNRGRARVGIYFSNPLIDVDSRSVVRLDRRLAERIKASSADTKTKDELQQLSFRTGLADRRFLKVSGRRLGAVAKVWRHD